MTEIVVRTAKVSDAGQIYDFIVELAAYENATHEVMSSVGDIEKTLFSDNSTAHALIAEQNNIAVGLAIYFFNYSTWLGKNGLYLEDLYVSIEHRGLGTGKKLMSHLASIALAKDCGRMEWSVLDWNQPAIDVYNAIGAKPQSEWIGYRLTGDALIRLATHSDSEKQVTRIDK